MTAEHRLKWAARAACLLMLCLPGPALVAQELDAAGKKLLAANGLLNRGMYKLAAQEYAEFVSAYPKHPELGSARYGLAICRYRLNEHAAAATLLEALLKEPSFKPRDEALAVLGHCRLAEKLYDKALEAFSELLSKHPDSPHAELAAINRVQTLYLLDKHADAIQGCQEFLKKYPNSGRKATAQYFQALAMSALGQHQPAGEALAKLLKEYPNSPHEHDALLLLGQCLEGQDKLQEAADQYRKALQNVPPARAEEFRYSLGVVLYKQGKHDQAIAELTAAVAQAAPGKYQAPARLQLGLAQLAAGKVADARKTLGEVAAKDAARAGLAKYWLAQCDLTEKKYDAALAALEVLDQASLTGPLAGDAAYYRAAAAMALGKHAEAAAMFEAFRSKYPKAPEAGEAGYRQAFCLHKLGKYDESLALCRKPEVAEAAAVKSAVADLAAENLLLLGKYPEAAAAFEALAKSAAGEPAKLRYSFRLGQCAHFQRQYAKAIELLSPVAAKAGAGEDLAEAWLLLGDAQLQTGAAAPAAESLAKYLAVGKRNRQEAQFKLAVAQLQSDKPQAAEQSLAALMAGPADSTWTLQAALEYGKLTYKQRQPDKAAPALSKVLQAKPPAEQAAPAEYLLAWIDFDDGKFPQAQERFAALVGRYPQHTLAAAATYQQAVCLKESGKLEQALTALEAYLKSHPSGAKAQDARQLVASCQSRLGKHDEAVKALAALAADKTTATDAVLYDLAWSQRESKQPAAAAETYRRLLAEFPQSKLAAAARVELAELLYEQQKPDQAAELLEQAVTAGGLEPKTLASAQYRLGWCYAKLNKPDKAGGAFAAFVAGNANHELAASALYQAGLAAALQQKWPEAAGHFSALVTKFPNDPLAAEGQLKLGEVQAEAEDYDKSTAAYAAFLAKSPDHKLAYLAQFGTGWSLESRGKHEEARQWYAKVIEKHSNATAARCQYQIGQTYFKQGDFEKAAQELLKVDIVYAYPEWSAVALVDAGKAFEQLKQPDQARKQYVECVRKYKDVKEPKRASEAAALAQKRLDALGP